MSDGSNAAVSLALGAGGGLLVWYLFRKQDKDSSAAPPKTAPTGSSTNEGPPRAAGPCSLLLTAKGLTTDGDATDIPTAVSRCKAAGSAQLVVTSDAPAGVYAELSKALHDSGVAVTVKAP